MNVEILNPEEAKNVFLSWGKFAGVCYDSHPKNPAVIGKHCLKSGHFSGSRSQYINFLITDAPRSTIDQLVRHEQGVCKNVQSFRYVNKSNLSCEIPVEIKDNVELVNEYNQFIDYVGNMYDKIQSYVMDKTGNKERANEQARYVLPMSTRTAVAIGFDIEGLIHFCNKRLCTRTEDTHRQLAIMIRDAVLQILPDLKEYLVPECQHLLWCPEANGCGAYPSKEGLKRIINDKRVI